MSFDWNLSSDEEDFDDWLERNNSSYSEKDVGTANNSGNEVAFGREAIVETKTAPTAASEPPNDFTLPNPDDTSDNDDDDEGIDWEDAGHEENHNIGGVDKEESLNAKPSAVDTTKLKSITIDMGHGTRNEEDGDEESKRNAKRRNRVHRRLPVDAEIRDFLVKLSRTHLLCLTGRAVYLSSLAEDTTIQAVAQSLMPALLLSRLCSSIDDYKQNMNAECNMQTDRSVTVSPTINEVRSWLSWYVDFVSPQRRRARQLANLRAGAPRIRHRQYRNRSAQRQQQQQELESMNTEETIGKDDMIKSSSTTSSTTAAVPLSQRLLDFASYWSPTYDEDVQLLQDQTSFDDYHNEETTSIYRILLLLAMARSLGWRTRLVQSMQPMSPDLDINHPIFMVECKNVMTKLLRVVAAKDEVIDLSEETNKHDTAESRQLSSRGKRKRTSKPAVVTPTDEVHSVAASKSKQNGSSLECDLRLMLWLEILCQVPKDMQTTTRRWIHVDPNHDVIDRPDQVEFMLGCMSKNQASGTYQGNNWKKSNDFRATQRSPLVYAIAVEHHNSEFRLQDVTPRYASSFVTSLRLRGTENGKRRNKQRDNDTFHGSPTCWWSKTLKDVNSVSRNSTSVETNKRRISSGANKNEAIAVDESDDDNQKTLHTSSKPPPSVEDGVHQMKNDVEADREEAEELKQSAINESIPTSKKAFQCHPLYVIPSVLGKAEVLSPDAKRRIRGVFKGEPVYLRSDVSTALPAKKWLYEGRRVRDNQKPIKRGKKRKKATGKNFKALGSYGVGSTNNGSEEQRAREIAEASAPLDDGMEDLYAYWQTDPWSPIPVGPTDPIPINEYRNIELELLNPGLVHIDERGVANVAKRLGIPYAPCLLGFEGHGGNRIPTIRGIVVHHHNEQLIREASAEMTSHAIEEEHEQRRKNVYKKWKKLMVSLLTKDRLEREYG